MFALRLTFAAATGSSRACAARSPPSLLLALSLAPAAAMVGGAQPAADGAGRSVVMIVGSRGTSCTGDRDRARPAADRRRTACCRAPTTSSSTSTPRISRCSRTPRAIARHPQFDLKRAVRPSRHRRRGADQARRAAAGENCAARRSAARASRSPSAIASSSPATASARAATAAAAAPCARRRSSPPASPATCKSVCSIPRPAATRAGLGACTGDSGAPVFRDTGGRLAVIGVVSWSTGPNLTAGCGGLTGVTPLVRYRDWILDAARKLGSPLAP